MAYTQVKTPIVYYGGKTSILPHLLEMVPVHEVYTETFFGGGTLFFAKKPVKSETINDKNDIVINFYKVLKSNFKKLNRLIDQSLLSRSMNRYGNELIRARSRGKKVDPIELAWAFWYTSNFNYSRKLGATYSYSNHKGTCTPDTIQNKKKEFTQLLVNRIEHAYIENVDALTILKSRNVVDAFHYLDPPYFHENGVADHGSYKNSFTEAEYAGLMEWCANECKGKFLLSNYNSQILDHYTKVHGWYKKEITHRIKAPRKSGPAKVEVMVSNYKSACGTIELFK